MTSTKQARPFQPVKLVFCLLVAALFWLLNALNKDGYSRNVKYPIRFVYNDSLYIPTSPLPNTVTVNVSGSGWNLLGQSWLPFGHKPLEYIIKNPLQATSISTSVLSTALAEQAQQLRVNYIIADTLDLAFDRRLTKVVRLVADSSHVNLAPRYVITSLINLTPSVISVDGPARLVRGIADTIVVKIPGQRIAQNFDEELPIYNFRHPLLKASADRVFISFEVGELLSVDN